MKKVIASILAALLALSLFGCQKKSDSENEAVSFEEDEGDKTVPKKEHLVWAVKSDNFFVSTAMMNYFFNTLYQQYSDTYAQMGNLDPSKSLKEQTYSEGTTWHDFFMDMTKDNVRQLLVLCEAAKAAGYKLDHCKEHDDHSAGPLLKDYETYAKIYGLSLDYYLKVTFGKGVNTEVFKQCYELSNLASHYSEHMVDSYDIGSDELEKYYLENKDNFEDADYNLKNFRYIPFEKSSFRDNEEDAKEAAEAAFAAYKDKPTEDNFIKISDEYQATSYEGGLVEGVDKGAIGDEVDAWLYDSARKKGDCEVITVEGKGSYLIYFVGDGDIKWQYHAKNAIQLDRYTLDYAALEKEHTVKYSEEGLSEVDVP